MALSRSRVCNASDQSHLDIDPILDRPLLICFIFFLFFPLSASHSDDKIY